MGEVSRRLGRPLMPWQQHVADVVLEVGDDGRLVYDEWVLTVPRQSGKSSLILAKAVHRSTATGFFGARQRLVYTAQTRNKAREKWEEDYASDLKRSKTWGPKVRAHFGNGNEHLRFPNGSRFGIEANTEKAGHGGTLDEAYIDEAFAQQDRRLEQAFSPAMITRPNTQTGVVSTAGWLDGSPYLLEKVRAGRDAVELGVRSGTAYFEWAADEHADPEDPATWWSCMPALGYTVTEDAVAAELRKLDRNDFLRAYLNRWVLKDAPEEAIIDPADWKALEDRGSERPSPVTFAIAVSPDRRWSYLCLAGTREDGKTHVQVVEAQRGTSEIVNAAAERAKKWKAPVAVDDSDPAGSLIPALEKARVQVLRLQRREVARGCGMFVDAVRQGTLSHGGGKLLSISLGAARRQRVGDAWVWAGPRDGSTDIAPLKAVTVALYGLTGKQAKRRHSGLVVGIR